MRNKLLSILGLLPVVAIFLSAQSVFAQRDLDESLLLASPESIAADAAIRSHMQVLAAKAVADHCAACHGADLAGQPGVPNLVDNDWIWGITGFEMTQAEAVFEIMQTILYGVRNTDCPEEFKRYGGCPDTRYSEMPAYKNLEYTPARLSDMTDYVLSLSGLDHDPAAAERAAGEWDVCAECHAEDGYGYKPFGGPDLRDDIWLFGNSREEIYDVIANGRTQSCPAWSTQLDAVSIKALSVYIYFQSMGI